MHQGVQDGQCLAGRRNKQGRGRHPAGLDNERYAWGCGLSKIQISLAAYTSAVLFMAWG